MTGVPTSSTPTTEADEPPEPDEPSSDWAWPCNDDGSWLSKDEVEPVSAPADTPPSTTVPAIGARTVSAVTVACAAARDAFVCARCAAASDWAARWIPPSPAFACASALAAVLRAASYCAWAEASCASACALSVGSGICSAACRANARVAAASAWLRPFVLTLPMLTEPVEAAWRSASCADFRAATACGLSIVRST